MAAYQAGFEALADPTRRAIFESIGAAPRSVGEIAGVMPVSRPAVSQHLKVLRNAGLVTVSAAGTRRIYAVDPAGIRAIQRYFDQFWTAALADFAATAEQQSSAVTEQPIPSSEERS